MAKKQKTAAQRRLEARMNHPELVTFRPDARDARKDYLCRRDEAEALFKDGVICKDDTNGGYCPRDSGQKPYVWPTRLVGDGSQKPLGRISHGGKSDSWSHEDEYDRSMKRLVKAAKELKYDLKSCVNSFTVALKNAGIQ